MLVLKTAKNGVSLTEFGPFTALRFGSLALKDRSHVLRVGVPMS